MYIIYMYILFQYSSSVSEMLTRSLDIYCLTLTILINLLTISSINVLIYSKSDKGKSMSNKQTTGYCFLVRPAQACLT